MPYTNPQILLVGNGLYLNRGCEAIVRGSMKIFGKTFGEHVTVRSGVMTQPGPVADQSRAESDGRVTSFSITPTGPRGTRKWLESQANKRLGTSFHPHTRDLIGETGGCVAALEVGGDNYSLEYGRPDRFMAMDRYLQKQGLPVFIWGASVGPFDDDPGLASSMFEHLRGLTGIFVRETESLKYLKANGVSENVHLTADPAFLMDQERPGELDESLMPDEQTIGVNFSPLVGQFRQTGSPFDLDGWRGECVELVRSLEDFNRPILLIPHVGSPQEGNDDFAFLRSVQKELSTSLKVPVQVLPDHLTAAELKWIISRCSVFAGARTHSTIAALSTGVPTLSIGYSLKARGINRDLFGSLDYCVPVAKLTPAIFHSKMGELLKDGLAIRAALETKLPEVRDLASAAGDRLRELSFT